MLDSVALVHPRDQLLANVAGEVEVDVGHRRPDFLSDLLIEKAGRVEVVGDRIDVGEAGEVADDRADAGAAAPARRQDRAGRAAAAHLERDLVGEHEQIAVEEEEAGEAEGADRLQLLFQARFGLFAVARAGVASRQQCPAGLGQLAIDPGLLFAGVAVAEPGVEVELEPLGEAQGLGDGGGVLGEALRHRLRRGEGRAAITAPLRLGLLQRHPQPDCDERVLQAHALPTCVRVHIAGGNAGHAEALREPRKPAVATAIAAPVGPLQLDPEAVPPEGTEQPLGGLRSCRRAPPLPSGGKHSGASAPRETDQPPGVFLELLQAHPRLSGTPLRAVARVGVRSREQPAEVAVAGGVLD